MQPANPLKPVPITPDPRPILLMVTSQDWGGVQAFLFDLACEMKKRGLPVKICSGKNGNPSKSPFIKGDFETKSPLVKGDLGDFPSGGELGAKCREAGIDFIDLRWMARDINPLTNLMSLFELIRLFRKEKPQAVHLNSTMMGVVGSLAAKLTSVPWTVYCIGGWVFNEQLPSWKKRFYIWIEKLSAHWKDIIVCVHPGDTELARRLKIMPRERLMTIPNGIDVDEFEKQLLDSDAARAVLAVGATPAVETQNFASLRGTVIGTVANAYPPKNLIWYLDVCKNIHEKDPDIKFVIVGDGPQMEQLRRKHTELKQEDYVLLAGRRMDAKQLYRAFDMFVLPSTKEGMSITLLEAMAARVPIVATDVGANKWMLDNTGIIVPPSDLDAMADAIINLAHDEKSKQELSEKAYQAVRARFSWKSTMEQTIRTLYPSR